MDWFDKLSTSWVEANPEEDYSVLPPLVRLSRIALLMDAFQKEATAPFDLPPSDYSVLAALRRSGSPFRLTPSELYAVLERSSGGMTKMLRRLEGLELIARVPDPNDGRSSLVQLTRKGQRLEREVFNAYLDTSRRLLHDLKPHEIEELDEQLAKLLNCFERFFYR